MLKKNLLLIVLVTLLFSCSSSKKTVSSTPINFPTSTPKSGDDGLSFATAIVITQTTEREGVNAEYAWIKSHYSNYTIKMQSLSIHDKKPFDVITITQANGEDLPLYFDISNYFGKF